MSRRAHARSEDTLTVLVIEDDDDVRTSLVDILVDEGHIAWSAPHGKAALEHLATCPHLPHLILLDLMMPIMDGWQFRDAQLADPALRDIPVVVVSATARIDKPLPGVAEFLKKPVDLERLLAAVGRHARLSLAANRS